MSGRSLRSSVAGHARLAGSLARTGSLTATPACPFPDDWQYGTVPDSITNEDELD